MILKVLITLGSGVQSIAQVSLVIAADFDLLEAEVVPNQ